MTLLDLKSNGKLTGEWRPFKKKIVNYTTRRRIFNDHWRMSDSFVEAPKLLAISRSMRAHYIFDALPKTSNETPMPLTAKPIRLLTPPSKNLRVKLVSEMRRYMQVFCDIFRQQNVEYSMLWCRRIFDRY